LDRRENELSPAPLDGNAAAGDLTNIFAFEVTTSVTTCAACHDTHPIATLDAYLEAPGVVLRCVSCNAVQIRLVRAPRRSWLDLRGIDMIAIPGTVTHDAMPSGTTPSHGDEATK
jgi:hypothetical protein